MLDFKNSGSYSWAPSDVSGGEGVDDEYYAILRF